MSVSTSVWLLVAILIIAANLPWMSERFLFIIQPKDNKKKMWIRLLEWLILYFVSGLLAVGMEKKMTGEIHHQDWEFYVVGFFLFLIFAFPGFIWRHELRKHLARRRISKEIDNTTME
jgi:hypothetical protein